VVVRITIHGGCCSYPNRPTDSTDSIFHIVVPSKNVRLVHKEQTELAVSAVSTRSALGVRRSEGQAGCFQPEWSKFTE
jgi:hypothetical protein